MVVGDAVEDRVGSHRRARRDLGGGEGRGGAEGESEEQDGGAGVASSWADLRLSPGVYPEPRPPVGTTVFGGMMRSSILNPVLIPSSTS